ncbi:MurR/RpiR family transcriptional regulator [Clostridium sp. NSJ-49]|uniref:Transcriptional regulator, RpiR family n=1 Tax=Clostridium disporicum TaxID=84024 RepID=A0A174K9P9_9CLOT|nr:MULTISPECIES: MurR/RpiR family transcriptional regulator [Clostridium]MBC5625255.1 MurR/RpiR family transcriptional regulator [Clostridium sp. NSJ-49]MCD2502108.1 MurR/RpiR family transcriptional regulator [Clostridium sp. NSJ-145]CUP06807.1 transcriptional regulator%2C RpiR family [Clostridium disporicum]
MNLLEKVKSLNELEYSIYVHLNKDKNKVKDLRLKEVADELHVSASMITRVCKKLGFDGFSEYKLHLRYNEENNRKVKDEKLNYLLDYFQRSTTENSILEIKKVANAIVNSNEVLFLGLGLSSAIAKYGALLLNRKGFRTAFVDDMSWRVENIYDSKTLAIILTVSGETEEVNKAILNLKTRDIKIVVISNSEMSTAASLADYSIGYYVPNSRDKYFHNSATQVPVIHIIESISDEVQNLIKL